MRDRAALGRRAAAALVAVTIVVAAVLVLLARGPVLRIGTLVPLAGPDAAIGAGMRNAMQLAIDEANRRASWRAPRFELVALDEGRSSVESRAAAGRLGEDRSIIAACAHYDEHCALDNNDVFADHELGNLCPGTIDHDITDHIRRRPVWFRIIPGSKATMRSAAAYAWEAGARRYAVVHDGSFTSVRLESMFQAGVGRRSSEPILELQVAPEERGFTTQVSSIQGTNTDYVLFAGEAAQGAALLVKLRAAGSQATFQFAAKYPAPELIALAGDKAEGVLSIAETPMPEDTPAGRAFLSAYAAAGHREPPGPFALAAYASMQALLRAVHNSNHTRPSVIGALKRGRFESALGPVRFDQWGQSLDHRVPLYRVERGRWTPIRILEDDQVKPWAEPQP